VVKRFRRKKISVIGDSHGRHLAARGFIDDFLEVARAIQQAVIRVQMQVNESGSFHAERYSNLAREFWLRRDFVEYDSEFVLQLELEQGSGGSLVILRTLRHG
jgi:hypothetical protein